MKRLGTFLILAAIFWVLPVVLGSGSNSNQPSTQVETPRATYTHTPEIEAMFSTLGLKDTQYIKVVYTDATPCGTNNPASGIITRACTETRDGSITMYLTSSFTSDTQISQYRTLAHEYLHVQYAMGHKADSTTLMNVYNSNYLFQKRMEPYSSDGVGSDRFLNELNSIECTEWDDSALPFSLLDYCKQYVPNRNVLPSLFR